jgi:hypothetical protein
VLLAGQGVGARVPLAPGSPGVLGTG